MYFRPIPPKSDNIHPWNQSGCPSTDPAVPTPETPHSHELFINFITCVPRPTFKAYAETVGVSSNHIRQLSTRYRWAERAWGHERSKRKDNASKLRSNLAEAGLQASMKILEASNDLNHKDVKAAKLLRDLANDEWQRLALEGDLPQILVKDLPAVGSFVTQIVGIIGMMKEFIPDGDKASIDQALREARAKLDAPITGPQDT